MNFVLNVKVKVVMRIFSFFFLNRLVVNVLPLFWAAIVVPSQTIDFLHRLVLQGALKSITLYCLMLQVFYWRITLQDDKGISNLWVNQLPTQKSGKLGGWCEMWYLSGISQAPLKNCRDVMSVVVSGPLFCPLCKGSLISFLIRITTEKETLENLFRE